MTRGPGEAPHRQAGTVLLVLGSIALSTGILAAVLLADHNLGVTNDFLGELWPAYRALHGGHVGAFISGAPSYVGAAVWRAPFALAAMAFGAGWRVTFLATAAPCFAVVTCFGVWFAGHTTTITTTATTLTAAASSAPRARTARTARRRIIVGFALFTVIDPVLIYAGVLGHPEEMVGAVLSIAAIVLAVEERHRLAAAVLILALLNKPGLAEVVPVVLVATRSPYTRPALILCMLAAILYAVYELTGLYYDVTIPQLTSGITLGGGFFPSQLLWWLGPSAWISVHEHVLLVPACVLLAAGWWHLQTGQTQRPFAGGDVRERLRAVLWLAAFIVLFRNAFDPWNTMYYSLPLVTCLFCLEAGQIPLMTVLASVVVVLAVPANRILALSAHGQAVLFTCVSVPALAALGWRAFRIDPPAPGSLSTRVGPARLLPGCDWLGDRHQMTPGLAATGDPDGNDFRR